MNVVPLNATTPGASDLIAKLSAPRARRGRALTGAALRNAPPEVQRKEVAAQFEAILLRQLLKPTMTSMFGKDGGAAGSIYGDLLTDTFATQLTRGGGLGLARMLEQQLTPQQGHRTTGSSDDPTAASSSPGPVVPGPVIPSSPAS